MRKWVALLAIFVALGFGVLNLIIPNTIPVKAEAQFSVSAKAFTRALFNEATWSRWWPSKNERNESPAAFTYHNRQYTILEKKFSSLLISIKEREDSLLTELIVIPVDNDSIEVNWLGATKTSTNPIERVQVYMEAKSLLSDLETLLQTIRTFYTNNDHLYGIHIREEQVVDSILISTSAKLKTYPTTEMIYSMIEKLKAFARKHNARETGLPMLNITATGDNTYLTKVALPVDQKLKDEGDIRYRWMLGGGNILATEVKGGPAQVEKAFAIMEQYVADHRRVAPAIPFQSLVTDRRAEPDTARWVTKIYWPVM